MEIVEIIKKKGFAVTAELGPPKGTNLDAFLKQAGFLKGHVHAVNVTDGQAGMMKLGSIAACHKLKHFGIEPIMQVTCRDRNRIAIQSDLLSASVLGIENVLVLTGDPVTIGDHPSAKPVFDIDAADLIAAVRKLETGFDMTGHKLDGSPKFCVAAAMNPCVDDIDTEISKTRNKVSKGAEFFQTQGVFDVERFKRFIDRYKAEGFTAPILAGIILLKSAKMANFMNEKIPGIFVPSAMIARLEKASDAKAECVQIAVETILEIRPLVQGFHIMSIGWEELVPEIVSQAGLKPL